MKSKILLAISLLLSIQTLADQSWIGNSVYIRGESDPTLNPINARSGTLYFSTNGNTYIKTDDYLSTNWNCLSCGGGGGSVTSIFDRQGIVVAEATDYSAYYLQISNNLSDLGNFATARSNLGLGSAATFSSGNLTLGSGFAVTLGSGTNALLGPGLTLGVASGYYFPTTSDEANWNGKQPPGNYITSLTGDVTASGPGSSSSTVSQTPTDRYVDLIGGNDSNSGSSLHRWKTIQHSCTVIAGLTSFNEPYTLHISGGTGNDTDSGTVNCPANVAYVADQLTQLTGNWALPTGGVNDNVDFSNLIFLGSVSWLRNDIYSLTMNATNTVFGGGLNFKQAGAGGASISASSSTFVGMDVQLPSFGSFFFNCQFTAAATFEDSNSSAYYQLMGGYIGAPMSFAGGPFVYMSGVVADVPFGYTLTTSTTSNGTPTLQVDSGSVPPSISGPNTLYLASFAQHESYSPATSTNWSTVPSSVATGLDQVRLISQSVVGSQPACTSLNRGLQWLIDSNTGVADVFQICQQTVSGFAWVTH